MLTGNRQTKGHICAGNVNGKPSLQLATSRESESGDVRGIVQTHAVETGNDMGMKRNAMENEEAKR